MTRALRFFALETGASTGFCNATAKANDAGIGMQAVADHKYSIKRFTITSINHMFNHMVELNPAVLDDLFRALADPTRRAMLQDMANGPRTVGELAAPYAISLAAASKHIQTLEHAGLVRRQINGRVHTCRLDAGPLHLGAEWLAHYERFWTDRLDVLEAILQAEDSTKAAPKASRKSRTPRRNP